jgi:hypothetical protein
MISDFANNLVLSSLASIKVGYPMRGRIEQVDGTGIRAVRLKDVSQSESIKWDECIETDLAGRNEPHWLEAGDVLFAAHGSHNTASYIDESFNELSFKAVATPMFFVLRVFEDSVLPEYLSWFINAVPSQRYFEQHAEGTRTKSVRRQVLESLDVVIPSQEAQEKIVSLANNINDQQKHLIQLARANRQLLDGIAEDLVYRKSR